MCQLTPDSLHLCTVRTGRKEATPKCFCVFLFSLPSCYDGVLCIQTNKNVKISVSVCRLRLANIGEKSKYVLWLQAGKLHQDRWMYKTCASLCALLGWVCACHHLCNTQTYTQIWDRIPHHHWNMWQCLLESCPSFPGITPSLLTWSLFWKQPTLEFP